MRRFKILALFGLLAVAVVCALAIDCKADCRAPRPAFHPVQTFLSNHRREVVVLPPTVLLAPGFVATPTYSPPALLFVQ